MAVIEFTDSKGRNVQIMVVVKTQLINLLRDAVQITHFRSI